MALWGLLAAVFALLAFRWEPDRRDRSDRRSRRPAVFAADRVRGLLAPRVQRESRSWRGEGPRPQSRVSHAAPTVARPRLAPSGPRVPPQRRTRASRWRPLPFRHRVAAGPVSLRGRMRNNPPLRSGRAADAGGRCGEDHGDRCSLSRSSEVKPWLYRSVTRSRSRHARRSVRPEPERSKRWFMVIPHRATGFVGTTVTKACTPPPPALCTSCPPRPRQNDRAAARG